MKKILLTIVACFAMLSANAWTVYFTNPDNWETVCIWAWVTEGDGQDMMGTGWPGKAMTQGTDGVWSYTQSDENGIPDFVIFNSGPSNTKQTRDLNFVNDGTYNMTGLEGEVVETWEVYFTNPEGWETPYAYTYGGSGEVLGSWPGTAMTKAGDLWVVEGDSNPTNIIFNNSKSGSEEGGAQTADYVFEAGATYDMTGIVTDQPVEAAKLYIIGGPVGWNPAAGLPMEEVAEGVFTVEVTFLDNSTYFAFANALATDASDWNFLNAHRYGPVEKDSQFLLEGENPMLYGEDASWQITPGTYTITVDINKMVAYVGTYGAIHSISSDNGELIIYNLNGIRVNSNEVKNGLYIINGKKVLVK